MAEAKKTTEKKKKKTAQASKKAKKTKKAEKKKAPAEKKKPEKSDRYFEGVGRRKTAVARVRLFTRGDKGITVNERSLSEYFKTTALQETARAALEKMNVVDKFRVQVKVSGGGVNGQAEAMRHGTARALLEFNPEFRKRLKRAGYLVRDPRMVERKKPGLKKARRAPQWSKR